jgi:hypothetical protein
MKNSSPTLPALGAELQKILAAPQAHTIGDAAAVVERLLAELQIMQNVPGPVLDEAQADHSLDALFEAELANDPLSADDVGALADRLRAG